MERGFTFAENEYYHVYNRGVEKRKIFMDEHDYERMALLLRLCNSKTPVNIRNYLLKGFTHERLWSLDIDAPIVDIGAWCLMPNHLHLLVRESKEGGISQFMLKVSTAYSMYFNRRTERVGSLMQGPFKAEHVNDDRYLQYLFAYIHLNPVKLIRGEHEWKEKGIKDLKGAEKFLRTYRHSSLSDYVRPGLRMQSAVIAPNTFPWKFSSIAELSQELTEWLTLNNKG